MSAFMCRDRPWLNDTAGSGILGIADYGTRGNTHSGENS